LKPFHYKPIANIAKGWIKNMNKSEMESFKMSQGL